MLTSKQITTVGLIALGGTLEFYDFTIFALFAPYLSQHFFAGTNQFVALMNTFIVFAVGYLARPLGAMVFGHLGDTCGRKYAFTISTILMATATLLIACLPSYQSIGIFAPLALLLLRIIQGFSVAGEVTGAAIFVMEHVPAIHRGLAVGIVFMFVTLGNTLGASIGLLLTSILDNQAMSAWGWRIPFLFGLVLGVVSYVIRSKVYETPLFISMRNKNELHAKPILKLIQTAPKPLIFGALLSSTTAASVSFLLYLPTYLTNDLHIAVNSVYSINWVSFFIYAIVTALSGWISDSFGRRETLIIGNTVAITIGFLLFLSLENVGVGMVWLFACMMAVITASVNGCYAVSMAESFSAPLRYSGVAVCHSVSLAIFGGLAPLSFTYLIQLTGDIKSPYYYLCICFFLSLIASFYYPKKHKQFEIIQLASAG